MLIGDQMKKINSGWLAQLTNKLDRNVRRDIRTVCAKSNLPIPEEIITTSIGANGREYKRKEYLIDYCLTMVMVTGYLAHKHPSQTMDAIDKVNAAFSIA